MSRALAGAVAAALEDRTLRPFLAAALEFDSAVSRVNSTPGDLVIAGQTFLGVGDLGEISGIKESDGGGAEQLALRLSGVNSAHVSLALNEHLQGRRCTIWLGLLDENHLVIGEPVIIFRGRMDTMPVELGGQASITVTVASAMADWERPRISRYTDEDQQLRYPGDLGLRYVHQMVERELLWGGAGPASPVQSSQARRGKK